MDDSDEDRYQLLKPSSGNHRESYGSLPHPKIPIWGTSYPRPAGNECADEDEDEEDEELGEEEDENDQNNGFTHTSEEVDDGDDDEFDEDEGDKQKNTVKIEDTELERHPKKRRLKSLVSSYEFAPRVPAPGPSSTTPSAQKSSVGGRNSLTDWNEHETFVLLDAWGDRFLQNGRKSLRSEEWQEVAEKVSEVSKIERTDTQCRNRLDTLKKKYKKEKSKTTEVDGYTGKWIYYKKMDMLMSSPPHQGGLSCGLDSGEYVFMNPRAYLNRANGLDEMRDSPGDSESADAEDNEPDGLPPKKRMCGRNNNESSTFKLLADSIHKFIEIYENIESSKRQQLVELEKMRMDFLRDLEMQKREIVEKAQAEIAQLKQGDDEEYDGSAKNASG